MITEPIGIPILVLRHGPTSWNENGRIQGLSDIPLSDAGASFVRCWHMPEESIAWPAYVSPLARAQKTAEHLGLRNVQIEDRLAEMDWGLWEGKSLNELRESLGEAMFENEARGLDFRPPEGESPREVQARLKPFLHELAERGEAAVLVTHKGIIRALYALSAGWDMRSKPAEKLRDHRAHRFLLSPKQPGKPVICQLNIPLLPIGDSND